MFLDMVNNCQDADLKNTLEFVQTLINLLKIIVPIILVIMSGISITKSLVSNGDDISSAFKNVASKLIAAALIFLIPSIIFTVLNMVKGDNNVTLKCWQAAAEKR